MLAPMMSPNQPPTSAEMKHFHCQIVSPDFHGHFFGRHKIDQSWSKFKLGQVRKVEKIFLVSSNWHQILCLQIFLELSTAVANFVRETRTLKTCCILQHYQSWQKGFIVISFSHLWFKICWQERTEIAVADDISRQPGGVLG